MENIKVSVGQLVVSKCGHDAGSIMLVIKCDGDYVFLCDGKTRKYANPKKKKIKHISPTGLCMDEINDVPQYAFDSAVRCGIKRLKNKIFKI